MQTVPAALDLAQAPRAPVSACADDMQANLADSKL